MSRSDTDCPACEGLGLVPCDLCRGEGSRWYLIQPLGEEWDPMSWELADCDKCRGERALECPECRGTGKLLPAHLVVA